MGQISVIKASAGSGKTYRLVYEYISTIIDNPTAYKNILAVTFTNKATSEMKSRIIEQLYQLSLGSGDYISTFTADGSKTKEFVKHRASLALNYILQDYSHFAVMTIDRFFQRIIRAFIHELGVDAGFTLELQTDGILTQATDSLIESIGNDDQLRRWITQYIEERISENKHWDIRSDIKTLGRELFNDSRNNLEYNKMSNEDLLRFVNRASQTISLIDRTARAIATAAINIIHNDGLSLNDFPYKSAGFANHFYKVAKNGPEAFGSRVIKALDSDEAWYNKATRTKVEPIIPTLRPLLLSLTETYSDNIKYINSVKQLKAKFRTYALLNDLADKVDAFCKEQSIVPISDTNSIINGLIAGNDTPFIFEKTGNRFTDYMIDEFQDTSLTQWNNFRPLIDNAMAQSEDTPVLLVGDIKQSIYRWRGGDWRILGEKINELYGSSLQEDNLDTNRRSFGNIVQFNNCLMSNCVNQDNDLLNITLQDVLDQGFISKSTFSELSDMLSNAYEQSQQKKFKELNKGHITITRENQKDDGEHSYIIEKIIELQDRGYAAKDITILVRNNSAGIEIANTILNYKTSYPTDTHNFSVITGEALLLKNASITCFIIAVLQLSCSNDPIQVGVYNKFLGNNVSDKISDSDKEFISTLRLVSLDEAFENIVMRYELNQNHDNISYLQAIHELIISLSTNKIYDIPTFLNWWNDNKFRRSLQLPENNDAINIVSIHKSKGLQYKVVIIPKCSWELGFISSKQPLIWSNGTAQFESLPKIPMVCNKELAASHYANDYYRELVLCHVDSINILYVALTRAIAELHICLPYVSTKGRKIDTIIEAAIRKLDSDQVEIKDGAEKICGKVEVNDTYTIYSFGNKLTAQTSVSTPNPTLPFPVNRPENKLKFKVHSTIDMQSHGATKTSPREYGILMHKIFENITSKEQILPTLKQMTITGEISNADETILKEKLETLLSNPLTEMWFDGNWTELMVERSILTSNGATYRPDRVLIKGDQVIVIDYKFGLLSPKSHEKALRNYMLLIKQMGYNSVTGYLWYVEQNRIDTHNLD